MPFFIDPSTYWHKEQSISIYTALQFYDAEQVTSQFPLALTPDCLSWKSFCRSNDLPIKLWLNHLCSIEGAFSSSNTFSSGMNTNTEAHCAHHTCRRAIFPVKDTEKPSKSSFSPWSIICILYGQLVCQHSIVQNKMHSLILDCYNL